MSDFMVGLIAAECFFFFLILCAAQHKTGISKALEVNKDHLLSEIERLNLRNVELTQELSSLRYR
jgi:hypothetical protein